MRPIVSATFLVNTRNDQLFVACVTWVVAYQTRIKVLVRCDQSSHEVNLVPTNDGFLFVGPRCRNPVGPEHGSRRLTRPFVAMIVKWK